MSVDVSQFHQIFFEESFEGLEAMESSLMALSPDDVDSETINTIFRAAHSIKGGSGTFGFAVVADFTHVLETLLDQIRSNQRGIDQEDIDLFLQSVDCLRDLLNSLQAGTAPNTTQSETLKAQFEAILARPAADEQPVETVEVVSPTSADSAPTSQAWRVRFVPGSDILRTGNEPLRMIRELRELCEVCIEPILDRVPPFAQIELEEAYFGWEMTCTGEVTKDQVAEVFEWVSDESEISIEPINPTEASSISPSAPLETQSKSPQTTTPQQQSNQLAPVINVSPDIEDTLDEKPVAAAKAQGGSSQQASSSIRVGIDKIDSLINMVGELVITQSMLGQLGADFDPSNLPKLQEGLSQLEQNTRELQESVMRIRMLPISFAFNRFPRMVRDLCRRLDKKIDLVLLGENTELDKTVMEKIGDPLVHLVRNSVDHGIETPAERLAAGKSATGKITLNAYHQGGNVVIEIIDDGKGLNRKRILEKAISNGMIDANEAAAMPIEHVNDLIFQPGFSTAQVVSDVSGRGVGMDVVRRNIQELNGSVEIASQENVGSRITIRLPLTLAILDGQLVRVGSETYIFPLVSIVESIQNNRGIMNKVAGGCDVFKLRDEFVPIIRLFELFNIQPDTIDIENSLLVVVEHDGDKVGIVVDELLAQQQVVIKSLEQNYRRVEGISGATILGDGTVALILDIPGLVKLAGVNHKVRSKLNNLGKLSQLKNASEK